MFPLVDSERTDKLSFVVDGGTCRDAARAATRPRKIMYGEAGRKACYDCTMSYGGGTRRLKGVATESVKLVIARSSPIHRQLCSDLGRGRDALYLERLSSVA
eukprot:4682238-Amphidinium_carterae.1